MAGGPSELDVSRFARAVHPAAGIVPQMNDTQDSMTSGIWRSNRSSIEATGTSERGETHSEGEVKAKAEDIANGVGGQGVGGAVAEVMRWTDVGQPLACFYDSDPGSGPATGLDPAYFESAEGDPYLVFGGGEIYVAALDPDTGLIRGDPVWSENNPSYQRVASRANQSPLEGSDEAPGWKPPLSTNRRAPTFFSSTWATAVSD